MAYIYFLTLKLISSLCPISMKEATQQKETAKERVNLRETKQNNVKSLLSRLDALHTLHLLVISLILLTSKLLVHLLVTYLLLSKSAQPYSDCLWPDLTLASSLSFRVYFSRV